MAWIESHQELARHPKTKRLAKALGISVPTAIGHLHLLWWWALDYAQDGDVSSFESDELADAAMWEGDDEQFFVALSESGFIDSVVGSSKIHDWDAYAGKLIDVRQHNAEKQKRWRDRHRNAPIINEDHNRDVTVTLPSRYRNVTEKLPATGPNTTQPNQNLETHVSKGAGAPAFERSYQGCLDAIKSSSNRPALLRDILQYVYGVEIVDDDIPRVGAMAKKVGAGKFFEISWNAVKGWPGVDNPLDWIAGALKKVEADTKTNGRIVDTSEMAHGENYAELVMQRTEREREAKRLQTANGHRDNLRVVDGTGRQNARNGTVRDA